MSSMHQNGHSLRERVLSRLIIDPDSGCLIWIGTLDKQGYGEVSVAGRSRRVHRVVYEMFAGPIPDSLQLDHLCRVRHCANVAHLEPVTGKENTRRGTNANRDKDACPAGHPYNWANTYRAGNGKRTCRACNRTAVARYKTRKAES